jgi:RNA polymerase-binding protein DksA
MASTAPEPLTSDSLDAIKAELEREASQLRKDLDFAQSDIEGIVGDSGSSAGDDLADVGSKTFEREQEMVVADQMRESLEQVEHALARIEAGTYGDCESCGRPIGRLRLEAYPRASLCMECKIAMGG